MKCAERGFTLLEVMIAVGVLGIAMLALLSLHDSNLRSILRGEELSTASSLAQGLMSDAELERVPIPGRTMGTFDQLFPGGAYHGFRWERIVSLSGTFPDIRQVQITVFYGPFFSRSFSLVEFLHDPTPQRLPGQAAPGGLVAAPGQSAPPASSAPPVPVMPQAPPSPFSIPGYNGYIAP